MHATECNTKPLIHFVIVIKSNHMGFTLCEDWHNYFKIISQFFKPHMLWWYLGGAKGGKCHPKCFCFNVLTKM